jgi:hypothetical protein
MVAPFSDSSDDEEGTMRYRSMIEAIAVVAALSTTF